MGRSGPEAVTILTPVKHGYNSHTPYTPSRTLHSQRPVARSTGSPRALSAVLGPCRDRWSGRIGLAEGAHRRLVGRFCLRWEKGT